MSLYCNIINLSPELKENIHKDLEIKIDPKYNMAPPRYIYPYEIDENNIVSLPFAYGIHKLKLKRKNRKEFSQKKLEFIGDLREEQNKITKESIKFLNNSGSIMISAYPGFGKTCCSIKLATDICFKTLIIVNKIVLMKQWEESINKFCPSAKIQKLTSNSIMKDCDFYIMNAQNVEKMKKEFFDDIGTLIVDEAHMIMAETLSRSLRYISPRYLIGLTATPYRPDGLNSLLDIYFGTNKIIRKLWKKHTVYKVSTNFTPQIEYGMNGRLNWGVVLDSQANNYDRNELIIKILKYFSNRNFLVLVKRIAQGEYLISRLNEEGENVTSLVGDKQEFNTSSRILIGTCQKVGVGFDHSKLDSLLLASDIEEYFIQYLGRVFRTKEVEPIIVDLVDNFGILHKHFLTRSKIYKECGGMIKNFKL